MLSELRIQGFALIEELTLTLGPSLNVLTGETGAGKSMVIDAITFVLGGRGGPSLVRPGAKLARVEATFSTDSPPTIQCQEWGVACEGNELVLARETSSSGRNTYRLNGSMVTQSVLKAAGESLVEIYGQHDQHGLLSSSEQLEILDRMGGSTVSERRQQVAAAYAHWKALDAEREQLRTDQRERERKREWLAFEADEIEGARLQADELESLESERAVLSNADKLKQRAEEASALLDGEEVAARTLIARAARALSQAAAMDARASSLAVAMESITVSLDEVCRDLTAYAEDIESNPLRLEQIQERLHLILRLQKKYGGTIPDILAYAANARTQLAALEHCEERQGELEEQVARAGSNLARLAAELAEQRRRVASQVEEEVAGELADLEMKGTRFAIRLTSDGLPSGPTGADRVEFLISPNPGQPMQALSKIASGGELSRIMLAIHAVVARAEAAATVVFDEVDAGLGGVAAEAVAQRLRKIAQSRQVICVTHLPLVAAAAAVHWSMHKASDQGTTSAAARFLDEEARAREIARMMAGKQASDTTLRQAKEMLVGPTKSQEKVSK